MSIVSILLLIVVIVSLLVMAKKKKLPLTMQKIIFFGFFGIVICCIPELMQRVYYFVNDEWLAVLFSDWFNKDSFALMGASALSWIIICGVIFAVVCLLWLLHKKISNNGLRRWPIAVMSVLLVLSIAYAEYGNGIYTFNNVGDFFAIKTACNMELPLLPNKVIMKDNADLAAAKCEAECFDLFTKSDNHDMLQLKFDGEVYIWRSNSSMESGYYPL